MRILGMLLGLSFLTITPLSATRVLERVAISLESGEADTLKLHENLRLEFQGMPITESLIQEIKTYVSAQFNKEGSALVNVTTPDQEITDGVLHIDVRQAKLGTIRYFGNYWYPPTQQRKELRLQEGELIQMSILSEDLNWMNKTPFHKTDAILLPGSDPGLTNIDFVTWDRFPLRLYIGFDDRGNEEIGTERMFAGFNLGNLFKLDHELTYQYTCSLKFGALNAHMVSYNMPLPWRDEITLYYAYSSVHGLDMPSPYKSHGHSQQASGRYTFSSQKQKISEWTLGYDYKITNNNLLFSETPVFSKTVALGQAVLSYSYQSPPTNNTLCFNVDIYGQPGSYLANMTNADYNSLRPLAKNRYLYANANIEWAYRMQNRRWSLFAKFTGQASTTNLLPSEELGLGGASTVRGYRERIFNCDNGILTNFEFKWDLFSILKRKYGPPSPDTPNPKGCYQSRRSDLFSLVAFFDWGAGNVHKASPQILSSAYLMGAGPGFRYDIDQLLHAQLDWGIQLHKISLEPRGTRIHFTVIASY